MSKINVCLTNLNNTHLYKLLDVVKRAFLKTRAPIRRFVRMNHVLPVQKNRFISVQMIRLNESGFETSRGKFMAF